MRHTPAAAIVLVSLAALLPSWADRAHAQAPAQPLHVFTASDTSTSNADNFLKIGGTWFFSALGRELWKSDGTPAGTVLVKDIGSTANPAFFTEHGGKLFFSNGSRLWTSDGTAAGTVLVKDTHGSFQLAGLTSVGGTLFFSADDGVHGSELWKSDGTAAGTVMVKDINPGPIQSFPAYLTNVDGVLFFTAGEPTHGTELWKSDGTDAGTVLVKDIKPGSGSGIPIFTSFAALGRTLYFDADDGVNGQELWKSDGTAAGTVLVKDINPGSGSSQPRQLTSLGTSLIFGADDGTDGTEPWTSDGTAAGTTLVADVYPGGSGSIFDSPFVHAAGTFFFWASTPAGYNLWETDGTSANTMLVAVIHPGSTGAANSLSAANGLLLAAADDNADGTELWRSDGTPGGTMLVKDIKPGSAGSISVFGATSTGSLLFSADDGINGIRPWASDGTGPGTVLLKADFRPSRAYTSDAATVGITTVDEPKGTGFNGKLLTTWFCDAIYPTVPTFCLTDGTAGGTTSATFSALQIDVPFTVAGTHAYFGALNTSTGAGGFFRTDGTQATTFTIKAGTQNDGISEMAAIGSRVFYAYQINKYAGFGVIRNGQLWTSTGTAGSTVMLQNNPTLSFCSGGLTSCGYFVGNLAPVGGTLLFVVVDNNSDPADPNHSTGTLWKTDGTVAGTAQVKSFGLNNDGTGPPGGFVAVGSTAYFLRANSTTGHTELWKTDGTTAGTVALKDVAYYFPFIFNDSGYLTNVNGTLYFVGEDVNTLPAHRVLWKSDGTTAGTVIVADIGPTVTTSPGPVIQDLTNLNGTLLFFADDGIHGLELWKSDGTAAGTAIVKEIIPGSGSPFPLQIYQVVHRVGGNHLFFVADEGVAGRELWRTDGTTAGTFRFDDVQPGSFSSDPSNLTFGGPNLYLNANTVPIGGMFADQFYVPNAVTCGNGVADAGEPCDDGNLDNGDGCTVACTSSACGDGFVSGAEQCDDGNTVDTDACPSTCLSATCGDGFVQAEIEPCDDGNATSGDGCDTNCTATSCGNGITTAGEECDAGYSNGSGPCSDTCVLCGNGATGPGEECDDGNTDDADGCTNRCKACGNGVVSPGEECDDNNLTNNDGCDANCRLSGCGNGILDTGEQCDDANRLGADCCDAGCQFDGSGTTCTSDGNVCTDDTCNGAGTCTHTNNAAPCDDGTFCNGADTCSSGNCTQHAGDPCTSGGACANLCNEALQTCSLPYGTPCPGDGNPCTNDQCDGTGTCAHFNRTGSCDDGLFCNGSDTCNAGTCVHGGDPCASGPECANACDEASDDCLAPNGTACTGSISPCYHGTCDGAGTCNASDVPAVTCIPAPKSGLLLARNATNPAANKLKFKWTNGTLALGQLGDPLATDAYTLCIYDAGGLVSESDVPPGGLCSGKPCWKFVSTGFKYKDKLGTNGGVTALNLKSTSSSLGKVLVKGKDGNLPDPGLPLTGPVTSQLFRSGGVCLDASYSGAQILRSDSAQFKAKAP